MNSGMNDSRNIGNRALAWLDGGGARVLGKMPWASADPYKVWVSEVMLQQTQVTVVRAFYVKFIEHFPDVTALANASPDKVIHLWAGMGYYARARNMHKAARIIVDKHRGIFPDNIETLCTLPGIGRSTAGAILSMTMNLPHPVLDTNVKRVLIRLKGIRTKPGAAAERELWQEAVTLMPDRRFGDYNKAMMHIGSLICRPKNPDCAHCPFVAECVAFAEKLTAELPLRKTQTRKQAHAVFFAIICNRQGELLLQRRPETGIWGGLHCFPRFETDAELEREVTHLCEDLVESIAPLPTRRHIFSHRIWSIRPRLVFVQPEFKADRMVAENENLWYSMQKEVATIGMPAPVIALIKEVRKKVASKESVCAKYFV